MARKPTETEEQYENRTKPYLDRIRAVAEARGQKLVEPTPRRETPETPTTSPEPIKPPIAKEPRVRSPLPSWARPLMPKPEPEKPTSPLPAREEQMSYINLKQRVTIFLGLLLEAAMLLYPPWRVPDWASTYHLFSSPPSWTVYSAAYNGYKIVDSYETTGVIDWQRLKIQCLIVGIITLGLAVLLGAKKSKPSATQE